ncbi:P27 family phage terminase small subunit [Trueperella pyogenes]|uniref:P27 family phage terminase small subunit n=1 Tax=Trueperella pyogenes TaxID=1661 RepID=UPI00312BC1FB
MKSRVPEVLGPDGRRLWEETLKVYELAEHELAVLQEACYTVDLVQTMRRRVKKDGVMSTGSMGQAVVHPLIGELRQQRGLFSQLMNALKLPDVVPGEKGGLAEVVEVNQHRQAAGSRWGKAYGA